jgi:Zn-dependent protease with chaperone function
MNIFRTIPLLLAMTVLFMAVGWHIGGSGGAFIALIVAIGTNVLAYWNSNKVLLRMQKARPITRKNAPELYKIVAELAQSACLPMPKLYVMENDLPNAFATGRNPQKTAVAVRTGILKRLNRDDLAGVVAHGLAHIKSRSALALASALKKIAAYAEQKTGRFGMSRQPATAHLFIINPLSSEKLMSLFSTHPPVDERARELEEIAQDMNMIALSRQTTLPAGPRVGGRV